MEYLIVYSHNLLPKLLTDFIENLYYALQKIMLLQNQILTHFLEYYYLERWRYSFSWSGREVHIFYDSWGFMIFSENPTTAHGPESHEVKCLNSSFL